MRKRSLLGRGLAAAGALVMAATVASVALGAPAKHKKLGKKAKPALSSAPAPADEAKEKWDPAAPAASDTPPAPPPVAVPAPDPNDEPAVKAAAQPTQNTNPTVDVSEATLAQPSVTEAGTSDSGLEALGRSEAARIAAGRTEVAVWVAAGVARRTFKYSDPVGQQYAPYRLPLAPMVSMGLEAYPFASSNVPGLRDFGFRAHFSKAFAVRSQTSEGVKIDTSWTRFGAEARQRLLLPGTHPLELGIAVGADGSYFDMSTRSVVPALLPSSRTISVRFGLDGRFQLHPRFGLALGIAYLAPTTRGAIYARFRDPQLKGVDGDFAAIVRIVPGLEARATVRYTRYFASFKPELGDRLVAGGALDEQLQFGLGVRYAH
ncbi:MAG: hypothetical protein ABIQ16_12765 [Polyangiaceae bacterium]